MPHIAATDAGNRTFDTLMRAAILFLALGACAPVHAPRDTPDIVAVTYACDDGSRVQVLFDNRAATATLHRDGARGVVLRQRRAASGIWYAAHGHELRGKGEEADIVFPGRAPLVCAA